MVTVKICPTCKYENKEDAAYCTQCGTALVGGKLDVTTRPVSDEEISRLAQVTPPARPDLKTGRAAVALFVTGQKRPILLDQRDQILLGREPMSPGEGPILDPRQAIQAGVSRNHATINYADGIYTVKDLGSTNGTFLNGKRLLAQLPYMLQSGDQIRLGALVIYIYFKA
jgi:pSer/pThr/pTyr-binding forkhead associated (FHA) protein